MSDNQISNFLGMALAIFGSILIILVIIFIIVLYKEKKQNKKKSKNLKIQNNENKDVKKNQDYTSKSIFGFMEFDKIEDNMIIKNSGKKFIMAIECQGINYDLMSGLEKNSVEQGFLQFLNALRYPIQLYIQTRTVNLGNSISRYKQKISTIRDEYMRKQMEYNSILNNNQYTEKELNNAKFELVKARNLYEYGLDIVNNTEKMNLNKNILKKHYYIIISYTPEETNSKYDEEEIKNRAFSDLYTRAQSLIASIGVCSVSAKVLNSEELAELLYIAYNRDEAEIYQLSDALKAGVDELYSTGKDVLDKRIIEINKEISQKAKENANEAAVQAILDQERVRKVKQKEARMNELIDEMAKELLDENEEILGSDVIDEAKKIIEKDKTKEEG